MIEEQIDIIEYMRRNKLASAICCTTNTTLNQNKELIMGKGIAKVFKEFYPSLPSIWGKMLLDVTIRIPNYSGILCLRYSEPPALVSFPTKRNWRLPSDLSLIEKNLKDLVHISNILGWTKIVLPRPGCSCGGLDWETQVKPLCEKLDDRFTIVSL